MAPMRAISILHVKVLLIHASGSRTFLVGQPRRTRQPNLLWTTVVSGKSIWDQPCSAPQGKQINRVSNQRECIGVSSMVRCPNLLNGFPDPPCEFCPLKKDTSTGIGDSISPLNLTSLSLSIEQLHTFYERMLRVGIALRYYGHQEHSTTNER